VSNVQIYSNKHNFDSPDFEFRYNKIFRSRKITALLERYSKNLKS